MGSSQHRLSNDLGYRVAPPLIVDQASLGAAVRVAVPSCSAAILVGSAVAGRPGSVADLDVTGFDDTVAPGNDRSCEFTWGSWPVHVVCYHPLHFRAIARSSDLLFVFMREIRKLQDGAALFDDRGDLEHTLEQLSAVAMPHHLLQPLVDAVALFPVAASDTGLRRVGLYHALENLTYAWMHFDIRSRYSKHKWLMDDAQLIPSRHLVPLLKRLSFELVNAHQLGELAAAIRTHATSAESGRAATLARSNVKDGEMLLQDGRQLEAVWPLRMSGYLLAQSWAQRWGMPYPDLRSVLDIKSRLSDVRHPLADIFRDLFLLDVPIARELVVEWETTRREFLAAWRQVREQTRSSGACEPPRSYPSNDLLLERIRD
jgi:hypothetical protein